MASSSSSRAPRPTNPAAPPASPPTRPPPSTAPTPPVSSARLDRPREGWSAIVTHAPACAAALHAAALHTAVARLPVAAADVLLLPALEVARGDGDVLLGAAVEFERQGDLLAGGDGPLESH